MSEKKLQCSRVIENFFPQDAIENLVHKECESKIIDAFLDYIEYGKEYIISTKIVQDDWADGFGTKYTYSLKFDELVRCRDCKHARKTDAGMNCDRHILCARFNPDGFCAWGVRRES